METVEYDDWPFGSERRDETVPSSIRAMQAFSEKGNDLAFTAKL